MDNASKAIVFAGSVLIAILIISLTMYFFNVYRDFNSSMDRVNQTQATQQFNRFFVDSCPNGATIFGYDAYNIIQKALEINNDSDSPTYINIYGDNVTYSDLDGDYSSLSDNYIYTYTISESTGYVESITLRKI
jgi:hypothetical protein